MWRRHFVRNCRSLFKSILQHFDYLSEFASHIQETCRLIYILSTDNSVEMLRQHLFYIIRGQNTPRRFTRFSLVEGFLSFASLNNKLCILCTAKKKTTATSRTLANLMKAGGFSPIDVKPSDQACFQVK